MILHNNMDKQFKKKSPGLAFLWLLLIPAQLIIDAILFFLGVSMDSIIFSGNGDVQGHGIPIFSVILPLIAIGITIFVIILSIVLVAVRYSRIKRRNEM